MLDWAALQPTPGSPHFDLPDGGCMRALKPCLPYAGLRDQLRALATRQRQGGWVGLAVITGTPRWAASAASHCDRPGTLPRARPPRASALPAYRALVGAVLALARAEGAELRYWSAWNEPNHPEFLTPPCGESHAAAYAPIARALSEALAVVPGDQQQVIGETAALRDLPRFVARLPRGLVCSTTVYDQHDYIGGHDPVGSVAGTLAARGCPRPHAVWITETGVGDAPPSLSAAARLGRNRRGCEALHRELVRWWRDPRVPVAMQYTLREDDRFPTGLVSTDLSHALPALAEWTAWGERPAPTAPPPPSAC